MAQLRTHILITAFDFKVSIYPHHPRVSITIKERKHKIITPVYSRNSEIIEGPNKSVPRQQREEALKSQPSIGKLILTIQLTAAAKQLTNGRVTSQLLC